MKITKLGHCCLLVEINGVTFLTDPGAYTTAQNEVMGINYIVFSHEHSDHLHIESLKQVLAHNPEAKVISNASVGAILAKENIQFMQVSDGEEVEVSGVTISGHGLKHAPIYKEYEQVENTGYFFDKKLFYPGDAFCSPGAPVDILAFPVTGPWCNVSDAMDYLLKVKPAKAFAVHDGNLIRPQGITKRLPEILSKENGIEFFYLELGKKYDF
jgi:L-ascorbate metabolism protein UlaG (beta-lactamase superfamily)